MWYTVSDVADWLAKVVPWLAVVVLGYKLTLLTVERLKFRRPRLPDTGWLIPQVCVGLWILVLLARAGADYLSARQLRSDAANLAGEIERFADEQQRLVPSENARNWDLYTRKLARVSSDTHAMYLKEFKPRVAFLRAEFLKRGFSDHELDAFYEQPSSPLVVRSVGERLAYLAMQLK